MHERSYVVVWSDVLGPSTAVSGTCTYEMEIIFQIIHITKQQF